VHLRSKVSSNAMSRMRCRISMLLYSSPSGKIHVETSLPLFANSWLYLSK
jgi:hypothetical protein